ncbi:hypothetical protein P4643_17750 [Priestia megaterium]|uniref:hypothetical protein n=1 Tax=Priestia megaterium TaxID=1404 RepID=UPI002E220412|nr:hypothetical protein [Priestia megaterium]
MFEISDETLRLINKTCKRKKHLKLTVGYLTDNQSIMKAVKLTRQKDIIMKLVLLRKLSLYRCYQNTYLKTRCR